MKTLTNEEINHIRNSVDIVDIASRYIPLTKKGKNYFGVCPFHEDSDPSLSVSPEKQIFSCFSCHTAGNVFNFVMEYEHISFIESVKKIADIAGIDVKISEHKNNNVGNTVIYDIYDISHKFYMNNINTAIGKKAKEYLNKRNIDETLIKEFEIGLALKSSNSLSNVLLKKEFKEKDLINSAIIVKDERGFHDFFYDRIVFPLHDINNKVIGYSGRIYDNSDAPKYVNSKEHSLFKKGEFIYNYYKAKDECRKKNTVIITEGFMDVIRCYSIGIKNAIATMGTAFTKQHVALIKRLASNVILCFDGDSAGNKATFACCEELVKNNIVPKIIRLEENLDPDEYILKYGQDKFMDKINNPISIMDYKLQFYKEKYDLTSMVDKSKYIHDIIEELGVIHDPILEEITIKKLSQETGLEEDFLRNQLTEKPLEEIKESVPPIIVTNKYDLAQLSLLFYMIRNTQVIKMVDNRNIYFPIQEYRLLAKEISYYYKKNGDLSFADLLSNLDDSMMKTIGMIESLGLKEEYTISQIEDYIKAIEEKDIQDECARLTKKMNAETDLDRKAEIGQKIMELLVRREKDV